MNDQPTTLKDMQAELRNALADAHNSAINELRQGNATPYSAYVLGYLRSSVGHLAGMSTAETIQLADEHRNELKSTLADFN